MEQIQFHSVTFTYPGSPVVILENLSFTAATGWTGIVGANGLGKSTILSLAARILQPVSGSVTGPAPTVVEQRSDAPPPNLADLLTLPDADAGRLVSMLGVEADWPYRWQTLSHGERKRAQIACALYRRPEALAVDEPTNHLDARARRMVAEALARFDGVGLIVSHDRHLLDQLCHQCLFLSQWEPPVMRSGGYSHGRADGERERAARESAYLNARAAEQRLIAEASRRRSEASLERQNRKRSKRGLAFRDSDAREKIDRARISGADGNAGRSLNQIAGRVAQARAEREALARPVRARTGVTLYGARAQADTVALLSAGTIALGSRRLAHPELRVTPDDRIAIVGENGCGKSTLVGELVDRGVLHKEAMLYVPQELSATAARSFHAAVLELERDALARVLSTMSRLGSDPERVRDTANPSPGEARKLMLALGFERQPTLLVMDEPTNHLDVTSAECLEAALAEFAGAIVLVSHDAVLVERLTRTTWRVHGGSEAGKAGEVIVD